MSSTGVLSSVIAGSPATLLDEDQRQQRNDVAAQPSQEVAVKTIRGVVTKVHESAPLIQAHTSVGAATADGQWIPLDHSLSDIVERFGKLRTGLQVRVSYTGINGINATATIVGVEGEQPGAGILIENKIQKGLYAIFSPGVGIG